MSEAFVLYTVQLVAILSATLLALGYLKANPGKACGWVFALGIAFVVLYIFEGMGAAHVDPIFRIDISPWPWRLLVHPAVQAVPGIFMIYSFLGFQEGRRFPPVLLILFLLQVLFEAIVLLPEGGFDVWLPDPLRLSLNLIQLLFVGLALYWTLKGWSDDLVQDRRLLRWVSVSLQGLLVFFVVVVENFLIANEVIDLVQAQLLIVTTIASIMTVILLVTLKLEKIALTEPLPEISAFVEKNKTGPSTELNADTFDTLFLNPGLYRKTGLTIAGLASELGVAEYRLREFVNQRLGYRNFNAMMHHYRVADACKTLSDPTSRSTPVVKIAQNVGYQSTTAFNHAFREIMGETPSEYRARLLNI